MITNIPKHWKIKKLGEIGVFFKGKGVPKNKITDTGFKCLTYGDLYTKYDFVIEGVKSFIDKETALISQEIRYGDICFAGSGETLEDIGKCATFIDDEIGYAGGDIIVFRTEQNPIVMSYLLNSDIAKKQKFSMGQGHSVVHIYSSQLEMLKLPLPPLEEQEKIAEILLTCDKAIRLTTQIITQLKQRNQGLAQQLLTGEKRVKGFEKSVWKEVRLGEIGEISSAGVDKKVIEGEKPIRLLNYLDVYKRNFIHSDELTHWVTTTDEKIQKCNILQGDVFFTPSSEVRNDIAISAVAIEDIEEAVYSYHIVRLRFKKKIDLNFKAFMFKTDFFFKQAQFLSEGSGTRYVISQSNFKNIKIFLPTYEEQKTIGNILLKAEKELKLYEQKLQLLQAQKKTLMQKLLTGEILTIK
jgi:type I restriction-modification enzyme 1, S subunit